MTQRPPCPPGASWLSPYLTVKDADAALAFYAQAFGFEKRLNLTGPDGKTRHAEMTWHQVVIMLGAVPEAKAEEHLGKPPVVQGIRSPISIYVYCEDVDALYQRAIAAGAKAIKPPQDQSYGDRTCALEDPDGYWWYFATNIADFGSGS
jgi:uncharacterized glyoxalase superfamily protein PhnB